uniref:Retrotransposon protein, putative, unclassified n=1 Tax=Oryza sativa subsp. japonica TaxID=39947 RepID=Q2R419_ORYSJ|nr:retrotransposon protein, putative, unclassified [Oryza sativa Japonica Group]
MVTHVQKMIKDHAKSSIKPGPGPKVVAPVVPVVEQAQCDRGGPRLVGRATHSNKWYHSLGLEPEIISMGRPGPGPKVVAPVGLVVEQAQCDLRGLRLVGWAAHSNKWYQSLGLNPEQFPWVTWWGGQVIYSTADLDPREAIKLSSTLRVLRFVFHWVRRSKRQLTGSQTDCKATVSRHFLIGLDMSIWEMKITSIQVSVDMTTLTLDSLYTKLKTHEMNILARKVDSKSSAFVSSSTSLDVGASTSKSSILALINATSEDQLEQFEEEDLALVSNIIARAMNNVRFRKRGGPNRCFECGAIDHLRLHCAKLGRGKKEDNGGEKTKENKPKSTFNGKKTKETLKKAFDQVYATFEPLSDVDGESEDEDKGKNISGVCFMAHDESDLEYEDNGVSSFEEAILILSAKNKKYEKMYRKQEFIIESLNSEIARLKSLIPNDDDCKSCEMKLKDALGRIEYMEDIVKTNEVLSCPKCHKSKGAMIDCDNCANLEKEVSYLKSSLQRFFEARKQKNEREIAFAKSKWQKFGFPSRKPPLVARKENMWIVDSGCSWHMTGDKNWFSSLKQAPKTESIIFGDASTSAVLATSLVKINDKFELKNWWSARPVRPPQDEWSDRPGSSDSGSVDADRDGPQEATTSTSEGTEHETTSEVVAPLHIQRHPPKQIIGNIGERTTRSKIYVDDIIFGCSTHALVVEFAETMHREFEMSMMAVLDPDEDGEAVDQKEYRNMIGSLLYLTASRPDIQFVILWLISTLKDYGLTFEKVPLFCDNTSAINIAKNPVQHSRTKHIDIRFHFLRDHVEKGDIELMFLDTKLQLADIFTKPLDSNRFAFLRGELGIIHPFGII